MTTRALATIRKVLSIEAIPNADSIELAHIDGWQCVVRKGEFTSNQIGVFFEIDSYLPIQPRYEFLRKSSYKKLPELVGTRCEGFRLRTTKLRGALSQGLLMSMSNFPELQGCEDQLGKDVTQILDVVLYAPPIDASLVGKVKGVVPSFIHKTHQDRIQNVPEYLDKYRDELYEVTEKINGTSMTVYYNKGGFGICGHNMEFYLDTENSYIEVAKALDIEKASRTLNKNVAIQGELAGEGIQGNPLKIKGHKFFVFDIWDIDKGRYQTEEERSLTMGELNALGFALDHAPKIRDAYLREFSTLEDILRFADGNSLINKTQRREGVVFKPSVNSSIPSFKVLSNDYLLHEK